MKVPLAFDASSYEITSSKKESDRLFRENGIPAPAVCPVRPPLSFGDQRPVGGALRDYPETDFLVSSVATEIQILNM